MNQRWNIIAKGLAAIGAVIVICISIARLIGIGSETLGDIAQEHPQPTATPRVTAEEPSSSETPNELTSPSPMSFQKILRTSRQMCQTQMTIRIIQGVRMNPRQIII